MGGLDVVDGPEHQRVVHPRLGRQADLDTPAGEDREVIALERGWLSEQRRPCGDAGRRSRAGSTTLPKPLM